MKTVLFMGQSNAVGAGTGGPWVIDSRVKGWNCEINRTDLSALGTAWVTLQMNAPPMRTGDDYNNQGAQFASYLCRLLDEPVQIILVARVGLSIQHWHDGTTPQEMYARMLAVLDEAGISSVDIFLWNQGSANNGNAGTYPYWWNALLAEMASDGIIDEHTPVVMSQTSFPTPAINAVLETIAAASPRIGIARLNGLPTIDDVHFTGDALVRAGWASIRALNGTDTAFKDILPMQDLSNYVQATGEGAMTVPSGSATQVPLEPRMGNSALIDNGDFVCAEAGIHRFMASVSCGTSSAEVLGRLYLNGALCSNIAWAVSDARILGGSVDLDLAEGDRVALCVQQSTGSAKTVAASHNNAWNRLTVHRLP
jgi:hypothetical protein